MRRGQVSWLVNLPEGAPAPAFPTLEVSGAEEPAQHLQWRDRSGLAPDSLRELCARHRDVSYSVVNGTSPTGQGPRRQGPVVLPRPTTYPKIGSPPACAD